jgi:hypothetical protein
MTRRLIAPLFLAPALLASSPYAAPGQTDVATATVTFEVREVNEISVSGDPGPLVVDRAQAGAPPTAAVDEGTTWSVSTNGSAMKITASLDAALPAGVTLSVSLAAPDGAAAAGLISLSPTAQDLVTQLSGVQADGLLVTYTLAATAAAGVVPRDSRIVTFTITAEG